MKISHPIRTVRSVAAFALTAISANATTLSFQEGVANAGGAYAGTADTWIASASGSGSGDETDTNYGSGSTFKVEDDPAQSDGQGLMRFDNIFGNGAGQISLGSTITGATLSITTQDGGFAAVPSSPSVHQMLIGWDEGSVSWDTYDTSAGGADGGMLPGVEYSSTADDGGGENLGNGDVGTWDVTAALAAWSAGGTNNGWAFIGTTNNGWDAYTSEFGTVGSRPLLTIDFTPVPEPTTTALLGLGGLALIFRRRK